MAPLYATHFIRYFPYMGPILLVPNSSLGRPMVMLARVDCLATVMAVVERPLMSFRMVMTYWVLFISEELVVSVSLESYIAEVTSIFESQTWL